MMPKKIYQLPKMRVVRIHEYRKKQVGQYLNRIGRVLTTDTGYQAPNMHLLLFEDDMTITWFFQDEVI